mmetsp:Transcript_102701/g.257471  ORF Transcript_102701/g.257471 Transcript_102701/m.257471 type:complete len:305 (+) Transcript_102701:95-1009(+)
MAHMATARRTSQKVPAVAPARPMAPPQLEPTAAASIRPPPGLAPPQPVVAAPCSTPQKVMHSRPPPGLALPNVSERPFGFAGISPAVAAGWHILTPPAACKGNLLPSASSFERFTSEETVQSVVTKVPEDEGSVSSNASIFSDYPASEPPSPCDGDREPQPLLAADIPPPPPLPYFVVAGGYAPGRILQQETRATDFCTDFKPTVVLQLADCVSQTKYGTPECPSVGSAGHQTGLCKPCDFFHRNSCRTGAACKFCHLCGPDENKRRKKQKQGIVRAMKRFDMEVAAARTHLQAALRGSGARTR